MVIKIGAENNKGEADLVARGIKAKTRVAKQTAKKDTPTFIANGKRPNIIVDIVYGKSMGTKITS